MRISSNNSHYNYIGNNNEETNNNKGEYFKAKKDRTIKISTNIFNSIFSKNNKKNNPLDSIMEQKEKQEEIISKMKESQLEFIEKLKEGYKDLQKSYKDTSKQCSGLLDNYIIGKDEDLDKILSGNVSEVLNSKGYDYVHEKLNGLRSSQNINSSEKGKELDETIKAMDDMAKQMKELIDKMKTFLENSQASIEDIQKQLATTNEKAAALRRSQFADVEHMNINNIMRPTNKGSQYYELKNAIDRIEKGKI